MHLIALAKSGVSMAVIAKAVTLARIASTAAMARMMSIRMGRRKLLSFTLTRTMNWVVDLTPELTRRVVMRIRNLCLLWA